MTGDQAFKELQDVKPIVMELQVQEATLERRLLLEQLAAQSREQLRMAELGERVGIPFEVSQQVVIEGRAKSLANWEQRLSESVDPIIDTDRSEKIAVLRTVLKPLAQRNNELTRT